MKRNVGLGIIVSLLFLTLGVCGCAGNNSDLPGNTESVVSLNQRQKDILAEQGLSTEYTELLTSQKMAIIAIEEMLSYAEEKYNTSFSYAGYGAPSFLEREYMRAYPTSGDKETDCFTITKTDTGYVDDYINVAANAVFVSYVCDGIKTILPDTEVKVYAEITKTSLDEVPTADTELQGKIESSLMVFIDGADLSEQDFRDFKTDFNEYLTGHQLYGTAQLILLKADQLVYLTKYNYTDYLSEEYYTLRETLYVNTSSDTEAVVLSQRQKEILEQMGLPRDYDSLDIVQKSAIVAIEDMLNYLENQYNETFTYSGYYEASSVEDEHLVAECSIGRVTVFRSRENGKYFYTDDFAAVSAGPQYREAISEYIGESFEAGTYKVFSVVNSINNAEVTPLHGASAASYIFFDSSVTETELKVFVLKYADWMKVQSQGNATVTKFYLLQADELDDIYDFNYEEKTLESIYAQTLTCSISDTGEINIF